MKKLFGLLAVFCLITGCISQANEVIESTPAPTSETAVEEMAPADELSYAFGVSIATSIAQLDVDVDMDSFMQGLSDVLEKREPQFTADEANQFINRKLGELQEAKALTNKEEGEKFLAENAAREGITVTESGLQYEVLKEGSGAKPEADDMVSVHYEGFLIDGTLFDSSRELGKPVTFGLNQVIPGWTEGVGLMSEGAIYKLYIPSDLAYGPDGAGGTIPGNAVLIFEVELLEVLQEEE